MTNEQKTGGPDLAGRIARELYISHELFRLNEEIRSKISALTAPIEAELADAKKELAELRAFAERFPKIATGERAYPDREVWAAGRRWSVKAIDRNDDLTLEEIKDNPDPGGQPVEEIIVVDASQCYSTYDAWNVADTDYAAEEADAAMRAAKEGK